MSKPKVYIIYGFAEGNWHGKLFRYELEKHGLASTDDRDQADIILAHSGGCFYLPDARRDQFTILINPPYWPGKPLLKSGLQNAWHNFAVLAHSEVPTGFWLKKTLWNAIYLLLSFRKAWLIGINARRRKFYLALKERKVLIIRSKQDVWLSPDTPRLLRKKAAFTYREAPGWHDHCWLYPQKYAEVIKSVYESR